MDGREIRVRTKERRASEKEKQRKVRVKERDGENPAGISRMLQMVAAKDANVISTIEGLQQRTGSNASTVEDHM